MNAADTPQCELLRVLIRVNASPAVGAGHAARSTALGDALGSLGATVVYACDPSTRPYLVARGVGAQAIRVLPTSATEGGSGEVPVSEAQQVADARATLAVSPADLDWVVVDSYLLASAWQTTIRGAGIRVAVFDDLVDREIDADAVINAATSESQYARIAPGATILAGLQHAVTASAPAVKSVAAAGSAVLIAFGASDPANMTARTLRALADGQVSAADASFRAWVQLGEGAPHRAEVVALVGTLSWASMIDPHAAIDFAGRKIGVAIGGAGVGLLERMRDGVPSIVCPVAPNQLALATMACAAGAAVQVTDLNALCREVVSLISAPEQRRQMAMRGQKLVDGRGASRIARVMNRLTGIVLRPAKLQDAARLHAWRNDPAVRAVSLQTGEIGFEEHMNWMNASLSNPARHILIAERRGQPVGVIRHDVAGPCATVSITVDPALQGSGLGVAMLDAGARWVAATLPEVRTCRAEIRPENVASIRAFESAGYLSAGSAYEKQIGAATRRMEPA